MNIPFALGFCYEHTFTFDPTSGEQYDNPTIWGPPFFGGPGFVGVKYLRSPTGAGEIQLFSNTINSATGFRDPANVFQLFRYLSGNLDPSQGDQACNVAGGFAVGICFINPAAADARFYQSSTALNLAPGGFGSIVVAYIFAAPVAIPGFAPTRRHRRHAGQPGAPHRRRRSWSSGPTRSTRSPASTASATSSRRTRLPRRSSGRSRGRSSTRRSRRRSSSTTGSSSRSRRRRRTST